MEYQDVEPTLIDLALVVNWSFELDFTAFKSHVQAFVFHVTDAKEGYACTALCKQNWLDRELLNISNFAEIVYVVIATKLIE